ncbi:hypothetical protein NDU88_007133 [Pleurodeles waltl]|uniref:Uncharacterized protein n=1 Tax=Pleurodeles waltl TaxID=8319 RepID=A0AAV7SRX5_PLEWA|nr:hypothetical protein NDU88_007133 [Pleurodeles waltl]
MNDPQTIKQIMNPGDYGDDSPKGKYIQEKIVSYMLCHIRDVLDRKKKTKDDEVFYTQYSGLLVDDLFYDVIKDTVLKECGCG